MVNHNERVGWVGDLMESLGDAWPDGQEELDTKDAAEYLDAAVFACSSFLSKMGYYVVCRATVEILADKDAMEMLRQSQVDIADGRVHDHEDVRKELLDRG